MQELIDYIQRFIPLSPKDIQFLSNSCEVKQLQNNEVFFKEGDIAKEIYFVTKGCVRLFYTIDIDEKTAFFYTKGLFICAGESYNYGTPALENYQSMGDTELLVFNRAKVENLLSLSPSLEIIGRVATESELIASQKIIRSFVTQTAEERYKELLKTNANLFQNVPQQYIASFLGISPETLSRIKSRLLRG